MCRYLDAKRQLIMENLSRSWTHTSNSSDLEADVIVGSVFMVAINVTAVVSNILVLTAIFRTPHLRSSVTNVFVVNLCVADLLGSVLLLPVSTASLVTSDWMFEGGLCTTHALFNTLFSSASVVSLCVISVERFVSIRKPMRYAICMTRCRAYTVLMAVWCQSALFAGLSVVSLEDKSSPDKAPMCTHSWSPDVSVDVYPITLFVFCYLCPGVGLLLMYVGVFRMAHNARLRVHPAPTHTSLCAHTGGTKVRFANESVVSVSHGEAPNNAVLEREVFRRKVRGQLKAAKTLILLIGMYLVTWGPHYTLNFYGAIYSIPHSAKLEIATLWLGYTSFAVNPFLYGWRNRSIREELIKQVLSVRCRARDSEADMESADGIGSKEDFLQFLERTTCSTRLTTVTQNSSGKKQSADDAVREHSFPTTSRQSEHTL